MALNSQDFAGMLRRFISWLGGLIRKPSIYFNRELYARQRVAQLLDYYKGFQQPYLKMYIANGFSKGEADNLIVQPSILNIVRLITDSLCQTFKNGINVTAKEESDQPIYDKICTQINVDNLMSTLEKTVFLTKTAFIKVGWRSSGISADLVTPEYTIVVQNTDDPYVIDEILYPLTVRPIDGGASNPIASVVGTFGIWGFNKYRIVDEKMNEKYNEDNPQNTNPYNTIPIAVFREHLQVDANFWEWPPDDLIANQDVLNTMLTQRNYLMKMQSYGVPVFVGISKESMQEMMADGKKLSISPSKPIVLIAPEEQNAKPPDFKFVAPPQNLSEVEASIEKEFTRVLAAYGLKTNEGTKDAKSAQSIRESNATIDEYRTNIRQVFTPAIKNLFDIITVVYNTHADELGLPKLSGAGVSIAVMESKLSYANVDEKIKEWAWKFTNKLATPIDFILSETDDITYDEAKEIYEDNIEVLDYYQKETAEEGTETLADAETEESTGEEAKPEGGDELANSMMKKPDSVMKIDNNVYQNSKA